MAAGHAKPNHDYHLVPLSPWPLVGSISAFVMAVGGIMWMKSITAFGMYVFIAGLLGVLYTMAAWWTDGGREAQHGDHTRVVQISHRYGMILFIASEVMFFVAWFWAYFDIALYPHEAIEYARTQAIGGVWPPKGTEALDPWHFPLFNTLLLLTSGTTVTWAHHALLHSDRSGIAKGLILTLVLGVLFTCVQAWEYMHVDFKFAALRLRGCRLVLALRRRGLAFPVLLHLRVGLVGHGHRDGEGTVKRASNMTRRQGGPWGRPFLCVK